MEVTVTGRLCYATEEAAGAELATLCEVVADLPTQGIEHAGTDLVFARLHYEGPSPQQAPLEGWSRLRAALQLAARFAAGGSLRWWLDGREHVAEAEADLPVFARFPPKIRRLLRCVVGEDFEGVEESRSEVGAADLPMLAEAYRHLNRNLQKAALVLLVCDTTHPALQDVMLNALRLPDTDEHDIYAIAQATALSHLKGDVQAQDWQQRDELRDAIQVFLADKDRNANRP